MVLQQLGSYRGQSGPRRQPISKSTARDNPALIDAGSQFRIRPTENGVKCRRVSSEEQQHDPENL
jgi:hypothetical protein